MLDQPVTDAILRLITNPSSVAVGATLQLYVSGWQSLGVFFQKLKLTEQKYITFVRELLPVYITIRHFGHFLEGPNFHVLMTISP